MEKIQRLKEEIKDLQKQVLVCEFSRDHYIDGKKFWENEAERLREKNNLLLKQNKDLEEQVLYFVDQGVSTLNDLTIQKIKNKSLKAEYTMLEETLREKKSKWSARNEGLSLMVDIYRRKSLDK